MKMKSKKSDVNDENQDLRMLSKCRENSDEAIEEPHTSGVMSHKKKHISYCNVYSKKPIFKRKLIEKYSSARYNFNTRLIYNSSKLLKKKLKRLNIDKPFTQIKNLDNICRDEPTTNNLNELNILLHSETSAKENSCVAVSHSPECDVMNCENGITSGVVDLGEVTMVSDSLRPVSDCVGGNSSSCFSAIDQSSRISDPKSRIANVSLSVKCTVTPSECLNRLSSEFSVATGVKNADSCSYPPSSNSQNKEVPQDRIFCSKTTNDSTAVLHLTQPVKLAGCASIRDSNSDSGLQLSISKGEKSDFDQFPEKKSGDLRVNLSSTLSNNVDKSPGHQPSRGKINEWVNNPNHGSVAGNEVDKKLSGTDVDATALPVPLPNGSSLPSSITSSSSSSSVVVDTINSSHVIDEKDAEINPSFLPVDRQLLQKGEVALLSQKPLGSLSKQCDIPLVNAIDNAATTLGEVIGENFSHALPLKNLTGCISQKGRLPTGSSDTAASVRELFEGNQLRSVSSKELTNADADQCNTPRIGDSKPEDLVQRVRELFPEISLVKRSPSSSERLHNINSKERAVSTTSDSMFDRLTTNICKPVDQKFPCSRASEELLNSSSEQRNALTAGDSKLNNVTVSIRESVSKSGSLTPPSEEPRSAESKHRNISITSESKFDNLASSDRKSFDENFSVPLPSEKLFNNVISAPHNVPAVINVNLDDSARNLNERCDDHPLDPSVSNQRIMTNSEEVDGQITCIKDEKNVEATDHKVLSNESDTKKQRLKEIRKWKFVPSKIFHYLSERHKSDDMKNLKLVVKNVKLVRRKRKKKKGFQLVKQTFKEKNQKAAYYDPYVDAWNEINSNEDSVETSPVSGNVGMMVHLGVNRPLFPEVYRNIVALNDKKDTEITDLWANFALSTLITKPTDKRFRSVFLPVKDRKLMSVIDDFKQETSSEFQEVNLEKVKFLNTTATEDSKELLTKKSSNTRKRKSTTNSPKTIPIKKSRKKNRNSSLSSSLKKRRCRKSTNPLKNLSATKVSKLANNLSPVKVSGSENVCSRETVSQGLKSWSPRKILKSVNSWSPRKKSKSVSPRKISKSANNSPTKATEDDELLLKKHGFEPCCVVVPKIQITQSSVDVKDFHFEKLGAQFKSQHDKNERKHKVDITTPTVGEPISKRVVSNSAFVTPAVINDRPSVAEGVLQEEDEDHFFGPNHCSRTYGQMISYRPRNQSLVFFHRMKRILRLQRQNNKLFQSCCYLRLRSVSENDEHEKVNVVEDDVDSVESCAFEYKPFIGEFSGNPLDILKTCRLHKFDAPMLKGIDSHAQTFPIRFVDVNILKSKKNTKWFVLQLNKSLLRIVHQQKHELPVELLFQIISRADLTKKVVCHTIDDEFAPNVLKFGAYGIPGLSEAVVLGPYKSCESHHNLTAVVTLSTDETSTIPVEDACFTQDTFFLWDDTKMRIVRGVWWQPSLPPPSSLPTDLAAFMVYLFNADANATASVSESRPKITPLIKQHPCYTYRRYGVFRKDVNFALVHCEDDYTDSADSTMENSENVNDDDAPIVLESKLRVRTARRNYRELDAYGDSAALFISATNTRVPRMYNSNRAKRNVPSAKKTQLRSVVNADNNESLTSILQKAVELIKNLRKEELVLQRIKNNLQRIRKDHVSVLKMITLHHQGPARTQAAILHFLNALRIPDRAEKFARVEYPKLLAITDVSDAPSDAGKDLKNVVNSSSLNKLPSSGPSAKKISNSATTSNLGQQRLVSKTANREVAKTSDNCKNELDDESLAFEHSYCSRDGTSVNANQDLNQAINLLNLSAVRSLNGTKTSNQNSSSSLSLRVSTPRTKTSDQVSVYLTENDKPITKLIIQRLKTANENSTHLTPAERRVQIVGLVRKILREVVSRSSASPSSVSNEERVLIPRLHLLQRMLEGVDKVRSYSRTRLVGDAIEISDESDEEKFSLTSSIENEFGEFSANWHDSSPFENGITCEKPWNSISANKETSVVDEQLSVENQIVLNASGDLVDFNEIINEASSSLLSGKFDPVENKSTKKTAHTKRALGLGKITKSTAVSVPVPSKFVQNAEKPIPVNAIRVLPVGESIHNVTGLKGKIRAIHLLRSNETSQRNVVSRKIQKIPSVVADNVPKVSKANSAVAGASVMSNQTNSSAQKQHTCKVIEKNDNSLLLRQLVHTVEPPKVRMVAKKSYSRLNYRKTIAELRGKALSNQPSKRGCFSEDDSESSESTKPDQMADSASSSKMSDESNDQYYFDLHSDLVENADTFEQPPATKFVPNIMLKSRPTKSPSCSSKLLTSSDDKFVLSTPRERIHCPSFVPVPYTTAHTAAKEASSSTTSVETLPFSPTEHAIDDLCEDIKTKAIEHFMSYMDQEIPDNSNLSPEKTSSSSAMESSSLGNPTSRLVIKSFASVNSFEDTCFTNMDKMLNLKD